MRRIYASLEEINKKKKKKKKKEILVRQEEAGWESMPLFSGANVVTPRHLLAVAFAFTFPRKTIQFQKDVHGSVEACHHQPKRPRRRPNNVSIQFPLSFLLCFTTKDRSTQTAPHTHTHTQEEEEKEEKNCSMLFLLFTLQSSRYHRLLLGVRMCVATAAPIFYFLLFDLDSDLCIDRQLG